MNRLRYVLLPFAVGALYVGAAAQPTPPTPPTPPMGARPPKPPKAPKAPQPPKVPKAPHPWGQLPPELQEEAREEMRRGLEDAIEEVEEDDDIPPAIRQRVLKALKKAQQSGDPSDLAELSDAAGWSADIAKAMEEEVNEALSRAGIHGGLRRGPNGGVSIDLNLGHLGQLGHDDDDDDEDDDAEEMDEHQRDLRRAARDQMRAQRDQMRAQRDAARAARDAARARDPWAPWGDDDMASPFDDPSLSWLPFARPGRPGPDVELDIDLGDLEIDLGDLNIDLDNLHIDRGQASELAKIASDEHAATAPAQRKLMELSRQLRRVVAGPNPNQAEIDRLVDAITDEERRIRKARLGALTKTRKLLEK